MGPYSYGELHSEVCADRILCNTHSMDHHRLCHLDISNSCAMERYQDLTRSANWSHCSFWVWHCVSLIEPWLVGLLTALRTCGVAVKRYITLLEIRNDDLTFSMVDPCVWTMIESSTTIICAAIPASTFVLRKLLPINLLGRIIEWFGDCINFSEDNATSTCEQIDTHVLEPPVDTASHEPTDQKSKISVV